METVTETNFISMGNSVIDKKLDGGIPLGALTLVEGQPEAGQSVLCQQILWGFLTSGHRASIFTTENTIRSLLGRMDSLKLDVIDYYLLGQLRIYPFKLTTALEEPEGPLMSLLQLLAQEDHSIIVDSLTNFLIKASDEVTVSFFQDCKSLCNGTRSIINAVHSYALRESLLVRISSICDVHLKLRVDIIGTQLVKTLEVAKARGAERSSGNTVSFDVDPQYGMRIVPYCKSRI